MTRPEPPAGKSRLKSESSPLKTSITSCVAMAALLLSGGCASPPPAPVIRELEVPFYVKGEDLVLAAIDIYRTYTILEVGPNEFRTGDSPVGICTYRMVGERCERNCLQLLEPTKLARMYGVIRGNSYAFDVFIGDRGDRASWSADLHFNLLVNDCWPSEIVPPTELVMTISKQDVDRALAGEIVVLFKWVDLPPGSMWPIWYEWIAWITN